MQINISGKNTKPTKIIKNYVYEKIGKLEQYMEGVRPVSIDVELHSSRRSRGQPRSTVELTLKMPNHMVRVEEIAPDMYEAIDLVQEKMERKLREFKERFVRERKKNNKENANTIGHLDTKELKKLIKRRKKFQIGSLMTEEEAIYSMELLGHDFYMFKDKMTKLPSVVYKREDGGYGVIYGK